MGYKTAAREQYKDIQMASSKPEEIVLMLYTGAIDFLKSAELELVEKKNVAEKATMIGKALKIIEYLQSCLDEERGGDMAANFNRLYDYMLVRLTEANLHNDAQKIHEVISLLSTLREGWAEMCEGIKNGGIKTPDNPVDVEKGAQNAKTITVRI